MAGTPLKRERERQAAGPPPTLLQAAAATIDSSLYDFFREVVSDLEYADFALYFTAEQFRAAARLALYDLWGFRKNGGPPGQYSEEQLLEQVGLTTATAMKVRMLDGFELLKQHLAAAFTRVSTPRSYIDHTSSDTRAQHKLYLAYKRLALHSDDLKVRELAGRALKETYLPVVKVRKTEARIVHMTAAQALLLDETTKMLPVEKFVGEGRSDGSPVDRPVEPGEDAGVSPAGGREPVLLQPGSPGPQPTDP